VGRGKKVLTVALAVLFFAAFTTAVASADTRTVCATGCDYNSIQEAVVLAFEGDTIYVYNGTYSENVYVYRRLTLEGEGEDVVTVTPASSNDDVFDVAADYVNISRFTVTGATGSGEAGIWINDSAHCNISYNNVTNNYYGIYLSSSSSNDIICNWVHHNTQNGFRLSGGSTGNTIGGTDKGNNIIANGELQADDSYHYQFYNDQNNDVEAKNNYWGAGMDNDKINASIYDWQEDYSKGNVTFLPKVTGPVPCAPIQEAATFILFGVGLLVLAGYVWIRRKD
jgi:parallel beta-helix repeat protein